MIVLHRFIWLNASRKFIASHELALDSVRVAKCESTVAVVRVVAGVILAQRVLIGKRSHYDGIGIEKLVRRHVVGGASLEKERVCEQLGLRKAVAPHERGQEPALS
jgi:hypothetical protein